LVSAVNIASKEDKAKRVRLPKERFLFGTQNQTFGI
jgi:hypothetical protein